MKMDISWFVLVGMYYKTVSYISNSADPDHYSPWVLRHVFSSIFKGR